MSEKSVEQARIGSGGELEEVAGRLAPLVYRVPAVAQLLGVSERYVWQLISDGELSEVRQGRNVGVRDDELRAYIDAHTSRRVPTVA